MPPGRKPDLTTPVATPHRCHRFEFEVRLRVAACDALRAWLRADSPVLPPLYRAELLKRARELTGIAVGLGLLD